MFLDVFITQLLSETISFNLTPNKVNFNMNNYTPAHLCSYLISQSRDRTMQNTVDIGKGHLFMLTLNIRMNKKSEQNKIE